MDSQLLVSSSMLTCGGSFSVYNLAYIMCQRGHISATLHLKKTKPIFEHSIQEDEE